MDRPEVSVRLPVTEALAMRIASTLDGPLTSIVSHQIEVSGLGVPGRWVVQGVVREYLDGRPQHWVTMVWLGEF